MNNILTVTHNAGFFSCCTQRLRRIIDFCNVNRICPIVDSSKQFLFYKTDPSLDITNYFFKDNNEMDIKINDHIFFSSYKDKVDHHSDQFLDYTSLNLGQINPFILKYFQVSDEVNRKINYFEKKYSIEYINLCSIFYRGGDKFQETLIGSYEIFIDKAKDVSRQHPNIKFLVQTDDDNFLNKFMESFPGSLYLNELHRTANKVAVHYEIPLHLRLNEAINFLAVTNIVSKSKIIITHSGNCGLWAILFRNNVNNVIQYLQNNESDIKVWYGK